MEKSKQVRRISPVRKEDCRWLPRRHTLSAETARKMRAASEARGEKWVTIQLSKGSYSG